MRTYVLTRLIDGRSTPVVVDARTLSEAKRLADQVQVIRRRLARRETRRAA